MMVVVIQVLGFALIGALVVRQRILATLLRPPACLPLRFKRSQWP